MHIEENNLDRVADFFLPSRDRNHFYCSLPPALRPFLEVEVLNVRPTSPRFSYGLLQFFLASVTSECFPTIWINWSVGPRRTINFKCSPRFLKIRASVSVQNCHIQCATLNFYSIHASMDMTSNTLEVIFPLRSVTENEKNSVEPFYFKGLSHQS